MYVCFPWDAGSFSAVRNACTGAHYATLVIAKPVSIFVGCLLSDAYDTRLILGHLSWS
jgi:hypothetical protein